MSEILYPTKFVIEPIFLQKERVGIVGRNGSGKTTLLRILTGKVQPDSGTVDIGITVKIGYFSQENEALDESKRVILRFYVSTL